MKMNEKTRYLAEEYSKNLREKLGGRVKQIILFGSHARSDSWEGSDYDMLVVVDKRTPKIREKTLDVSEEMMNKHERLFTTLLYDESEWHNAQDFPLAWNIRQEGIHL